MKKHLLAAVAATALLSHAGAQYSPQDALYNRGRAHGREGDFGRAIADFTELILLNPTSAAAHKLRGRALFASALDVGGIEGNFDNVLVRMPGGQITDEQARVLGQAIEDFTQAIRLDPSNAAAYRERGRANVAVGNLDLAMADFSRAIRIDPNFAAAYLNRGAAHFDGGSFDLAIADFTQVIRIDPDNEIAHIHRGAAHFFRMDFNLAAEDFTQAIHINSDRATSHYRRGLAHANKGRYDLAIADFEAALRLDPNNCYVMHWLDNVRRRSGL